MKWRTPWGDVLDVEVGMPEQSIYCDGEITPFQSADAQCDDREGLRLVLNWLQSNGDYCGDSDPDEVAKDCERVDEDDKDEDDR